jgi:crotonobetainyl-CoA:carnitine CoA-transferase CaiB-like acyl-CoA transferase
MIDSDPYWPDFCEAVGQPEWREDPRFDGAIARYRNAEVLCALLADLFAQRPLSDWESALESRRLIWSPVRSLSEALHDEQARATGVFAPVEHPVAGRYETVRAPIRLSGHAMPGDRPAPALGADSEAVLREAGLDAREIAEALGSGSE